MAVNQLKPNEARLLLFMALTARDTDNPPLYFGSWERSARALGRLVPDRPSPDDPEAMTKEAERQAARQRVKVAMQGLVRAGAIARQSAARPGRTAEYVLCIPLLPSDAGSTESDQERGTYIDANEGRPAY